MPFGRGISGGKLRTAQAFFNFLAGLLNSVDHDVERPPILNIYEQGLDSFLRGFAGNAQLWLLAGRTQKHSNRASH